ncbi:MAG: DNA polymerase I [Candidatus Gastranaerophilaceae bacterium]
MGKSKTLILIDGHALAFRQYYALERTNMKTKDGTPTWAVYGFFKAIFDLLKNDNLHPDAIGVAFDVSHHTFRTEKYEEYKANRVAMPDPMRIQMGLIYEGLKAFNIPIYTKEGFEADDVIGTISRRACELGHNVYILTGDQDSFQLIRENGCIKVIIPSKGDLIEYDWNRVYDKLGVYPNQIIDYKALRGDTSDNIPGIRGIGEKTAVKLLSEFKTVDNVLANIDKVSGNSIKEKLQNGIEDAKLSKYLATIVQDVDVQFGFDKTEIELPDITDVTDFLRSMQFYSFLKNIEQILKLFDSNISIGEISNVLAAQEISAPQSENKAPTNGQLGLFSQDSEADKTENITYVSTLVTDTKDFEDLLQKLKTSKIIAVKLFADVENAINSKIYGIALGLNPKFDFGDKLSLNDEENASETYYIPVAHNIEKQLDKDYVFDELKSVLENSQIKKITHDVKQEFCILKNVGVNLSGVVFDTMLASYIKNSNANSSFDIQCMEQINHILPTIVTTTKKSSLAENDILKMNNYVADVISSLFNLTSFWVNSLTEREYSILTDIEIPLAYVLADMEYAGVCVDTSYLKTLTAEMDKKLSSIEGRIYEIAGEGFNINSPKQVAHILFDKLQLKTSKKRGKSKNSTNADILNSLAEDYEIAGLILEYRKYAKLKSTYTEALPALIDKIDGRIHTTYNQTVTTTGRLSSSNPNLQNIPIRTEDGSKIRQAFVPQDRENGLILSADYSQIELRLLAHVSGDINLINAFRSGIDVHTLTASKVFDVPMDEVTKEMRYKSKAVNFGIVYGQSKYGLAKSLHITPAEAESFMEKYFETYPGIKDYMQNMVDLVEQQGYIETIFGRRRYLESEINSPNVMIREFAKRAAINHPMQGSASDLIKLAMIDFAKSLKDNNLKSKLIIQVHDELVVELYKDELDKVKELIIKSMELNQPLKVPLVVDINVGDSWKEL